MYTATNDNIDRYIEYLEFDEKVSEGSIKASGVIINRIIEYQDNECNGDFVEACKRYMNESTTDLTFKSRKVRILAFCDYMKWDVSLDNCVFTVKYIRNANEFISIIEQCFKNEVDTSNDDKHKPNMLLCKMACYLAWLGLSSAEINELKVSDCDLENKIIHTPIRDYDIAYSDDDFHTIENELMTNIKCRAYYLDMETSYKEYVDIREANAIPFGDNRIISSRHGTTNIYSNISKYLAKYLLPFKLVSISGQMYRLYKYEMAEHDIDYKEIESLRNKLSLSNVKMKDYLLYKKYLQA